ncbi:MAG: PBP1A family penicillin-binding protein [Chitinispirillales bacterium]|nr:PBP1A family penicillin-binding protein [Chitinispirillales bacterium]
MDKQNSKMINITPLIIIAVILFCFSAAFFIMTIAAVLLNTYKMLPEPHELADIQPALVSKVYANDGSLINEFSIERRFWVSLDSIPDVLKNAIISIEDKRFNSHWGVDSKRIISAALVNLVKHDYGQGASTLTQQLVRNIYFTQEKKIVRKIREILTSVQIEKYYTKDEIIELYINTIYLGGGTYGFSAAAQKYFSKSVYTLNLNEASVLAGIIQLPEYYRPDKEKNIERITVRRRSVLKGMLKKGYIDKSEFTETDAMPIPSNPFSTVTGKAPYFIEQVRRELENKFGADMLYNSGLSIYTTLDPLAQFASEVAVEEHLNGFQQMQNDRFLLNNAALFKSIGVNRNDTVSNFDSLYSENEKLFDELPDSLRLRKIEASVLAMDVNTGAVRVMIGGRDFEKSKFNRALQGVRHPGSAFKPFVYAAAMNNGYTPASVIADRPITIIDETRGDVWRPENIDKKFYGDMTIREALRRSVNLVAVQVIQDVGPKKVVELAKNMGFSHNLPAVPALALGTCEATNFEITRAYCAFANQGLMPDPYFVEKVVDKNGKIISRHENSAQQVIEPILAELMTILMQDVILRGTGASIRDNGFTRPAAGKTGTTNNYTDAWFVGYTPQIACGVWIGTDRNLPMGMGITGSRGAIPIWTPVMKSLHRDLQVKNFESDSLEIQEICPISHELANNYCPNPYKEVFLPGIFPNKCSIHTVGENRDTSNALKYFGTPPPQNTPANTGLIF